jgi:rSAM/selenodomain-associated transferase 1
VDGRRVLAIVCRNPDAGAVKTRLIPAVGADGARALYRAFLRDLGERFSGQCYDLLWAYTPEGDAPPGDLTPGRAQAQEGPDLGHRLLSIFQQQCLDAPGGVAVISSDVPHLSRHIVERAFAALDTADVVLAPSDDGGYHLVAMRAPHDIFSMVAMSTPAVLSQTRAAIAALALHLHLLEGDFDVDLPEDLPRLTRRLREDPELRDSHTARHLRATLGH